MGPEAIDAAQPPGGVTFVAFNLWLRFDRGRLLGENVMLARLLAVGLTAFLISGCASVHQEDLNSWRGHPVADIEKHPIFVTLQVVKTVASDGTEIRDYVNGKNVTQCSGGGSVFNGVVNTATYNSFMSCTRGIAACHAIFTVKNGIVENLSAIGTGGARCYSNEATRPGFSGSVNIR